jgi:molybdopterin-guanine dinucleotide biosynthesis protein A
LTAEKLSVEIEPEVQGFVLAGGRSRRMGTDKAFVSLDGLPLLVHALEILSRAGLPAAIVGGNPELAAYAPLVVDRWPDAGPLGGICSGLASMVVRWAVFIPVDTPLIPSSLIACLVRRAASTETSLTLASVNGFPQTFPAVLDRTLRPGLEEEVREERLGCFTAFQKAASNAGRILAPIAAESLLQCGQVSHPWSLPARQWFLNINTAEKLGRAESLVPAHRVS